MQKREHEVGTGSFKLFVIKKKKKKNPYILFGSLRVEGRNQRRLDAHKLVDERGKKRLVVGPSRHLSETFMVVVGAVWRNRPLNLSCFKPKWVTGAMGIAVRAATSSQGFEALTSPLQLSWVRGG